MQKVGSRSLKGKGTFSFVFQGKNLVFHEFKGDMMTRSLKSVIIPLTLIIFHIINPFFISLINSQCPTDRKIKNKLITQIFKP